MRQAVVRKADGFVQNVIEIEPVSDWKAPAGFRLVDAETAGSPGDTWDGSQFITPDPVEPSGRDFAAELDELKGRVFTLETR